MLVRVIWLHMLYGLSTACRGAQSSGQRRPEEQSSSGQRRPEEQWAEETITKVREKGLELW